MNENMLAQLFSQLSATVITQTRHNLEVVNHICSELHQLGSQDFSLATIGRISEQRGGISLRSLYNSASDDYKLLIQSWENLAVDANHQVKKRFSQDTSPKDIDLLKKINNLALRTLIDYIIAKRDPLHSEIKILRANSNVVIDRRTLPGHVNITPKGQVVHVMSSAGLSDTEKKVLDRAISQDFLTQ